MIRSPFFTPFSMSALANRPEVSWKKPKVNSRRSPASLTCTSAVLAGSILSRTS